MCVQAYGKMRCRWKGKGVTMAGARVPSLSLSLSLYPCVSAASPLPLHCIAAPQPVRAATNFASTRLEAARAQLWLRAISGDVRSPSHHLRPEEVDLGSQTRAKGARTPVTKLKLFTSTVEGRTHDMGRRQRFIIGTEADQECLRASKQAAKLHLKPMSGVFLRQRAMQRLALDKETPKSLETKPQSHLVRDAFLQRLQPLTTDHNPRPQTFGIPPVTLCGILTDLPTLR